MEESVDLWTGRRFGEGEDERGEYLCNKGVRDEMLDEGLSEEAGGGGIGEEKFGREVGGKS